MQIIEENSTNWLILTDEGSTATKTKSSDLNQLLYGHDLWGLIDEGTEIWMDDGADGEPSVTIIPDDNAECFTLRVGDAPDLTLGEHHKTDLIDALAEVYDEHDGDSVAPLIDLYDEIRENMVRQKALSHFLDAFSDKVGEREDGWFINGHLLLTYEGDFYHPRTESRKRSGQQVIGDNASTSAYGVNFDSPDGEMNREITIDGQVYRLTDSEMEFLAKALWAMKNTPEKT